jgi:G3E family GTPase
VGSIALVTTGAMDVEKIQAWLSELLPTQGQNIFRMKGILNIHAQSQRFVLQGVHMIMDARFDREWRVDEDRKNQLVLIGRNLDELKLRQSFHNCLISTDRH